MRPGTALRRRPGRSGAAIALVAAVLLPASAAAAPPDSIATARLGRADLATLLPGVAHGACPVPGVLTAGQPDSAGVTRIAAAGYRALLDLRTNAEARGFRESEAAKRAGLRYVKLAVGRDQLPDGTLRRFRAFMNDPANHPVVVHCASGNRVGALLLPWLVLDRGMPLDQAVRLAEESGLRGARLKARALAYIDRERAARP
jgi:protein tyrosine phosphatase (PTP) superfamily phosphohydrolase (DUF442 family)